MPEIHELMPDAAPSPGVHPTAPLDDQLSIMVETVRVLSVAESLDAMIASITHAARKMLHADGVTFILRDGELCHYVDETAIAPLWKGERFPASACISGWCMRNGQSVVIPDVASDPRIPQDLYNKTFVRSLAMVPIRKAAPMAALGAYWSTRTEATNEQMAILEMLANAASLAIDRLDLRQSKDETMAAVEHQRLLLAELSHRVKDTLAVVQSLALQTIRSASSLAVFRDKFLGRLHAVGAAHALLLREDWKGVALGDLIEHLLRPYHGRAVIQDDGKHPLRLTPKAHLALAMILHELAANAVAHGGLVHNGNVAVNWTISDDDTVVLSWNEAGIAAHVDISAQGFGLSLVNRLVEQELGGTYHLEYAPSQLGINLIFPHRGNVQQPPGTASVDLT